MASPLELGLAEMYHRKCWEPNHLNGFISHHGCLLFHTYLSGSLLWSPPSIWLLPILCAHIYARQENHSLEVWMSQHNEVVYVKGEKNMENVIHKSASVGGVFTLSPYGEC